MDTKHAATSTLVTLDRDGRISQVIASSSAPHEVEAWQQRLAVEVWAQSEDCAGWLRRVHAGESFEAVLRWSENDHVSLWSPLRIGADEVAGAIVLIPDITAADAHLRASNAALQREVIDRTRALEQERNMFISGPVAVFRWRNQEGWPVEYVSPNIEAIIGYSVDKFLSGEIVYAELISPADIERVTDEVVTNSAANVTEFEHEPYRLTRSDGKELWIADYTTILRDDSGNITHYLGYIINITERQEAQEALRQAKEELEERVAERTRQLVVAKELAEQANRAKSEFLARMSHELRTPLNAILGYAEILRQNPSYDKRGRSGVDIIHRAGEHLLMLINDVLDLAKIEARKLELVPTAFDLPDFLAGIADIFRLRARECELEFVFEADGELPWGVQGDAKRLRQVLLNLLSNACKFTDAGRVEFRVQRVPDDTAADSRDLDAISGRARIHFAVRDTGMGISAAELAEIFHPFEQFGEARHRAEGTGLGLAISQQLVRAMDGEITVQSTPGEGSLFEFTLDMPLCDLADAESYVPRRIVTGYQGKRRTVLVVDDRTLNRLVIKDVLEPLGFEVLEAADGAAGIATARESRPDVILMDMVMPVMTGFEATRQIREDPDLEDMVIIATSASVFSDDQKDSMIAGCDAFLPKPVKFDALFALLEEHLGIAWMVAHSEARDPLTDVRNPQDATTAEARAEETEKDMLTPPAEVLNRFYDAVMIDDTEALRAQLDELLASDAGYEPFARQLRQRIDNQDGDAAMVYLERLLST